MKNNYRYNIYKFYSILKSKLAYGSSTSRLFAKVITFVKDIAVKVYVFYVSRLKYCLSSRLTKVNNEVFINDIYAAPHYIRFLSQNYHSRRNKLSPIRSGKWDKLNRKIEDLDSYISISAALKNKKPIQDTHLFQKIVAGLENGEMLLGCRDKQSFIDQWKDLLFIFNQKEHRNEMEIDKYLSKWEPVQIDIGRHGDLLISQGELPLILAKLLDLQTIPIKIVTRHTMWVIFRKRFHDLVTTVGSRAYQPPLHPDLVFIPAEQSCFERYEIMKRNLSFKDGNLLELGANAGFFSIKFEEDGFNCVAVESFPGFVFCLRGQRKALNKSFTIIPESFLNREDILNREYDVVLALNVFSHLIVQKEDFDKLNHFLENLKCKEMFFEPYSPTDPQMKNAHIYMSEDEFADYVRSKLRFSRAELIGRASDKRRIYKIY